MKAFKLILGGLLLVLGLLYAGGLMLPDRVHVERSIEIQATPEALFLVLNSFQEFNRWSPWFARDPDAEYRYEGPESGVGARMSWASKAPDVGTGSQEIIRSIPYRRIDTLLDFGPDGTAIARFDIESGGETSRVTWSLDTEFGDQVVSRYIGLIFDQLIGPDYELGLRNLKQLMEDQEASETL